MSLQVLTNAFPEGATIPRLHTCEGADLSPALEWSGEPPVTKSFAVIVDDPDAPAGVWNHWLLYDIQPGVHSLAQGFTPGRIGESALNDFGKPGYNGPCPPKGHGPHRYYFRLYAVDAPALKLSRNAKRSALDAALKGHVLAEAQYMGRYERS
jgi:Raf kinase inhibitor-like YbhB/YbcL family protein